MDLKISYLDKLKNNDKKEYLLITRFLIYLSLAFAFFCFMQIYSPLGINWRPYHYERVLNGVKNIYENLDLSISGYTSWLDPSIVNTELGKVDSRIYVIPIINYILPAVLFKIIGNFYFLNNLYIVDFIFIAGIGIIISEIGFQFFSEKNYIDSIFYSTSIFTLYLASPWVYRMILVPWPEVPFVGFYLLSIYSFSKNKKIIGLIFFISSVLFHWIYGVILFLFQALIIILTFIYNKKFKFNYLPKGLQNKSGFLIYSLVCLIPLFITFVQNIILSFKGITLINNGPLYRVGIDSLDNIHHGGLIGAFQFLGGNRYSVCFLSENLTELNRLEKFISIFNCTLSITGVCILSLISLIGIVLFMKENSKFKWILGPITWSFFFFALIFQQSFSAHLQGHSFVFAIIFSFGLTYIFKSVFKLLNLSSIVSNLIMIPLLSGILINLIRVSFFTGLNG